MSLVVIIRNISQLAAESDYEYVVRVGDGSAARSQELAKGVIRKHRRRDGWQALVQRVVDKERFAP